MKLGARKPSIKKSISARTTGKMKRTVKKAVIPTYGKKGSGFIKNPSKSIKNSIYNKTTYSIIDTSSSKNSSKSTGQSHQNYIKNVEIIEEKEKNYKKGEKLLKSAHRQEKIVNKTNNPISFFKSYEKLISTMKELIKLENTGIFNKGTTPTDNLKNIEENKEKTINNFINRYYEKTLNIMKYQEKKEDKLKSIENFSKNLSKYKDKMTKNNIENYEKLNDELKNHLDETVQMSKFSKILSNILIGIIVIPIVGIVLLIIGYIIWFIIEIILAIFS